MSIVLAATNKGFFVSKNLASTYAAADNSK